MDAELFTYQLQNRLLDRVSAPKPAAAAARDSVVTTAELSECTCPDFCERDHGNE